MYYWEKRYHFNRLSNYKRGFYVWGLIVRLPSSRVP